MIAAGVRVSLIDRREVERVRLAFASERRPDREPPPDLEADIPTRLGPAGPPRSFPIRPIPPAERFAGLRAILRLLAYVLTLFRLRLSGQLDEERKAKLTRALFERMSGMWIKAGQLMSLRTDLLSEPMCRELSALQFESTGFPPEIARKVIEEDLRMPIERAFAWFDPQPFAAASICQVHRATLLKNNRAVVVKVMRPDVRRSFERDLRLFRNLVFVLTMLGIGTRFRMQDGLKELEDLLREETDYRFEAVNLKRMRKRLRGHGVHIPRLVADLSGSRVLVMEEVPGVLMSRYIAMRREDPRALRKWEIENGVEPREVAVRLAITTLRQILEDNEFHGDLHPGNIMLLSDNRIALLDLGSVGRLEPRTFQLYRLCLAALGMRDFERAADYMLLIQPTLGGIDPAPVRKDLMEALQAWALRSEFPKTSYDERSLSGMSTSVAQVLMRHGVPVGWSLLRVGRCLSTLDASLQVLAPDITFMKLTKAYFKDRVKRGRGLAAKRDALRGALAEAMTLLADARLVLGNELRGSALRARGVLDAFGRVRVAVTSLVLKGLWVLIGMTLFATFLDQHIRILHTHKPDEPWYVALFADVIEFLPDLHGLTWLALLAAALFAVRVLQVAKATFVRGQ